MAEAASSNNKKTVFISKLDLILRKKIQKCYMRSGTGALRIVDKKLPEICEMWCWNWGA
jgi:hypothetical protein